MYECLEFIPYPLLIEIVLYDPTSSIFWMSDRKRKELFGKSAFQSQIDGDQSEDTLHQLSYLTLHGRKKWALVFSRIGIMLPAPGWIFQIMAGCKTEITTG
jgi:hypothetical protein